MREEGGEKIEAHVAPICFDGSDVLMVKRSPERRLYPGLWECGGGQVRSGEGFQKALIRQAREEFGIDIEIIGVIGVYEISPEETGEFVIPGVKFVCRLKDPSDRDKIRISKEHTQYSWKNMNEFKCADCIEGIQDDIKQAYSLYKNIQ